MRVIFLDIDGVLNSDSTPNPRKFPYIVDKRLLVRFQELVNKTGATVVLSSTWRVDPVGRLAEDIAHGIEEFLAGRSDKDMRPNAIVRLGQNIHALFGRDKS